jgi:predicted nucleic acid-binding Zn ribbon protein
MGMQQQSTTASTVIHHSMRRNARIKRGVSPLGTLLGDGLSQLQIDRKIKEHTAPLLWAEVVGPQVAGRTEVMGVTDGVLRVSTASSVWAHELTYLKARILNDLNTRLGAPADGSGPYIKDILFQNRGLRREKVKSVRPAAAPTPDELDDIELSPDELEAIEAGIAGLTDERMRERMRRLRASDARLRTWRIENGWVPCERCGELAPPRWDAEAQEVVHGEPDCPCRRVAKHLGR